MEICADCGKPIEIGHGSYYATNPVDDIGKSFHSNCGDQFGIKAAVAAERERYARIAENWLITLGHVKPEFVNAQQWASDAVRDIAEAIRGADLKTGDRP